MNISAITGRRLVRLTPDLRRHIRKCCICRHPRREELEADFLLWRNPREITAEYGLAHHSAIYRHAHATGLASRRLFNAHQILDYLIEKVESAPLTGNTIIRAMRAYSCIDRRGRWTDPPRRIVSATAHQGPRSSAPSPRIVSATTHQGTRSNAPSPCRTRGSSS